MKAILLTLFIVLDGRQALAQENIYCYKSALEIKHDGEYAAMLCNTAKNASQTVNCYKSALEIKSDGEYAAMLCNSVVDASKTLSCYKSALEIKPDGEYAAMLCGKNGLILRKRR